MAPLSALQIVEIWERGAGRPPVERALLLLAAAHPELSHAALLDMSIGCRDASLLELRQETLGPVLRAFAECPSCHAPLEFSTRSEDLPGMPAGSAESLELLVGAIRVRLRHPTSADVTAAAQAGDPRQATRLLAQLCVVEATRDETAIPAEDLPDACITEMGERLAESDPRSDMLFELHCASCRHRWEMIFDIASYFWTEINGIAKRLLLEVHTLARAYCWREADILAMSAARRQLYLEMVG